METSTKYALANVLSYLIGLAITVGFSLGATLFLHGVLGIGIYAVLVLIGVVAIICVFWLIERINLWLLRLFKADR